jgi:tetratricopeptide (TPR) repeat protein
VRNYDHRGAGDVYKIPFFVLMCAVMVLGGYMLLPTKYTGPKHSETRERGPPPHTAKAYFSSGDILREELDSGLGCEQLMSLAKEMVDKKQAIEWDSALDLLATCALLEPENSAPLWNLAVILLRMNHTEEALEFIDQALTLDPNNLEYLRTSGEYFSKLGMHRRVVRCLESYLEVALHVPSWEHLLASISVQREDEWMFLYDAGDDVIDVFEVLQSSYLQEMSWIKAGYLYKVIIGLKGGDVDMNTVVMYSIFAFGLGDFATGIKYLRRYTEKQYMMEGYGDSMQAYDVVTAHSLRLLTAGFDSQILSIAKNLLMAGDSVWEELVYNCELSPDNKINFAISLRLEGLKKIVLRCLRVQNIIKGLIDDGAVVYAENLFGWSPLLHVAALGGVDELNSLLRSKADPQSRTVLAHTSLHIAAMRGGFGITLPLIQAGLKSTEVDYFNRTALQVACLHGWSAEGMAKALNQNLPHGCPVKPIYHPPPKLSTYGGWLPNSFTLPKALVTERCDFDVLAVPDVRSFTYDYLALQRPVLIRNATSIHSMKKLYQLWQRSKFKQEFGALVFNEVEVPFAEAFGFNTTKKTSAKEFMAKMRQFQERTANLAAETISYPSYIFETLPPNSPLLNEFRPPSVLDEEITHISPLKMQFYMGPPLSGSPVHFHRSAWNLLIYGQKRWFLYPPNKTYYSKKHVWDWWKENYRNAPDALECVQHPGDMMFVPDMWGHAVINLREGVGVASEFIYGASEFSI